MGFIDVMTHPAKYLYFQIILGFYQMCTPITVYTPCVIITPGDLFARLTYSASFLNTRLPVACH